MSNIPGLIVIARSSSFAYKGRPTDVRRIAEDLGVGYIVEGSVQKSRSRVRVVVQLSDGVTGSPLWAERYDRELDDIFAVQDEVARRIVTEVSAALSPVEIALWPGIASGGSTNMEAYQGFLRGRAMQRGATQNLAVFEQTSELFRGRLQSIPLTDMSRAYLSAALGNLGYLDKARQVWDELMATNPSYSYADRIAHMPSRIRKISPGSRRVSTGLDCLLHLGSGLIDRSQKMTAAAMQMADIKV